MIRNVLHNVGPKLGLGGHYEGICFVETDIGVWENIFNHSETFLITRSDRLVDILWNLIVFSNILCILIKVSDFLLFLHILDILRIFHKSE